jgi:hypothetical protein
VVNSIDFKNVGSVSGRYFKVSFMKKGKFIKLAFNRRFSIEAFTAMVYLIEVLNGKIHLPTMNYDTDYDTGFRSVFDCDKNAFKKGVQELIDRGFLFSDDGCFYELNFEVL